MTYGFALLTVGTVLAMSGYNNVPVAAILKGAFQSKKHEGPGSGFVSLVLESAKAPAEGGKEAVTPGGAGNAPGNKAAVLAKVAGAATKMSGMWPYSWAGGHAGCCKPGGQEENGGPGYDCSGAVSCALCAGGLLSSPLDSSALMSYGQAGPGKYITIYANPTHTFMKINGVWFGTGSDKQAKRGGPAWGNSDSGNLGAYTVRHPKGF